MTNEVPTSVAGTVDEVLARDLAAAAREIAAYLRHRQVVEEQQSTWRAAAVVFVATLITSATVTRFVSNHHGPVRHELKTDITKVASCNGENGRTLVSR
jgi:hypothetical protein